MNIKINDTGTATIDAETIISCSNSFESLVGTLTTIKENFESNWIVDGNEAANNDRNSIINSLNSSINYYQTNIIPALSKLGNAINAYAIATEQLAAASAKDPSLKGMTPSEYADANLDPVTIVDQTAYSSGEANMGLLTQKISDDPVLWQRIDEMYLYYKDKGLSDEVIAGILGNAAQESGFILDAKNPTSSAKGLFQWTTITADNQPTDWSFDTQLDHSWNQIQNRTDASGTTVITHLNGCSDSVSRATTNFAIYFEGCTDSMSNRQAYASAIYTHIKDNFYRQV